jgi:Fe-S-cluster containining protein
MTDEPWFKNGLRFQCTGCGDCCTGAPGFVWVNGQEIAALAARLGQTVEEFESKYVRRVGVRRTLVEFENGDCVFFDGQTRKCTVYEDRPRQCKTWPFWDSNVRTEQAWRETCQACPGSGRGQLYPVEKILESVAVIKI